MAIVYTPTHETAPPPSQIITTEKTNLILQYLNKQFEDNHKENNKKHTRDSEATKIEGERDKKILRRVTPISLNTTSSSSSSIPISTTTEAHMDEDTLMSDINANTNTNEIDMENY